MSCRMLLSCEQKLAFKYWRGTFNMRKYYARTHIRKTACFTIIGHANVNNI